jgi:hypothetical protein
MDDIVNDDDDEYEEEPDEEGVEITDTHVDNVNYKEDEIDDEAN